MLIPSPAPTGLGAAGRLAAVLALAAGLSTAAVAVLTHGHPHVHRSAAEWTEGRMPAPEGAAVVAGGMESSESSSDPRRSGPDTP